MNDRQTMDTSKHLTDPMVATTTGSTTTGSTTTVASVEGLAATLDAASVNEEAGVMKANPMLTTKIENEDGITVEWTTARPLFLLPLEDYEKAIKSTPHALTTLHIKIHPLLLPNCDIHWELLITKIKTTGMMWTTGTHCCLHQQRNQLQCLLNLGPEAMVMRYKRQRGRLPSPLWGCDQAAECLARGIEP